MEMQTEVSDRPEEGLGPTERRSESPNIETLLEELQKFGLAEEDLQMLQAKSESKNLTVAVLALMKAGKSSLLNAMLGQEFCPATVEPQTAALLRIQHDVERTQGLLLDGTGTTLAEGRANILQELKTQNDRRRQAAQISTIPEDLQVQESQEELPSAEGTYILQGSSHGTVSIHAVADRATSCVLVLTLWHKPTKATQYFGLLYTGPTLKPKRGKDYTVLVRGSDAARYRSKLWSVVVQFEAGGLQFRMMCWPAGTCFWPATSALKSSSPPCILRAECIHGDPTGWFSSQKGVATYTDWGFEEKADSPISVGDKFAVQAVRFWQNWLQDCDGHYMRLFSSLGSIQFRFLTADDSPVWQERVQVCHNGQWHDGTVTCVSDWRYTVETDSGSLIEEVEAHSLLPLPVSPSECKWEKADEHDDLQAQAHLQQSSSCLTLHAPVLSFDSCASLGLSGSFTLMDTPGPNEAQAALKVELKLAIESADVIIYLLDYTKIGSTDEQQMFDQLRESCEAMISKQSSRFWFLLNKIDEKKEVDDIDKIKDFVSQRIRKMLKDIPIHPHQIVPISAKKAYFGRQAQFSEGERLHKDPEFRQEFEKIAFGESANSLKDSIPPEVFTMLATQAAESMVKGSEICSFEEQVLHSIMKDKERIMAEKLCDAAVSILDVVDNSAHFELAALGATQNTLTKRVEKGKALVERLKKQLMAMEKDIADKNHEENFEQIVAAAIDKMFGNAKKMIDFLFDARSLQELEVGLRVWVQLWGEDGKLKVPAKFKSREEAERFVQSQNTKLQSMLHQFCQYECKGMAIELNEASGKLQDDVRRAARPVLEFMLKEAGSMLDLNMKTESFRFQHVADTNVEELLKMGARHESLFNENTTKVQRSRIEKAPWYFLGLFRWGTYDKQIPYIAKVVDSHSVKGSSLKKLWKQHIGLAREEMHKLIMSGIKQVISYELKHAKDHIHHRCNELLTIISENHDRYELDCEAASSRKTELLAKCKRCSEILNYVKAVRKECGLVCNDSSSTEDTDLGEPTCTSCSEQGGEEDPPISPLCGPCDHAIDLQWEGDEEPFCVLIDGKPCASQGNGSLRSPKLPSHCGQFDVEIQWKRSLPMTAYSGAFTTHFPGEICSIEPSRGPTRGGFKVVCTTTDMVAPISELSIGGRPCQLCDVAPSTITTAAFILPLRFPEGPAKVEVRSKNGNMVCQEGAFVFHPAQEFDKDTMGEAVEVCSQGQSARRVKEAMHGVCLGRPMQMGKNGYEFTISVDAFDPTATGRVLAVGFYNGDEPAYVARQEEAKTCAGCVIGGYESRGSHCYQDGVGHHVTPKPGARIFQDMKESSKIRAVWSHSESEESSFQVFLDGLRVMHEKVKPPKGTIRPLVDLQGHARQVSFLDDC